MVMNKIFRMPVKKDKNHTLRPQNYQWKVKKNIFTLIMS